ncbi:uncharacterized protein N0V89_004746 [Didymosphaeria variabile]|uniref:2EXR domain-containing protein n=1 Tax=Didymosphaeria variabile TaxID=1932322 RepID=A0A9W9CDI5_9PLEO|nr:uncharacterized protein N0V89_004746 [Didymosphaeria variabile]KAJ4356710.1 hypothetical protein N0V89_004746 [Didymosphaeria variabile]
MADATTPEVRTSKRKRAQVKYYEEDVSDEDSDFVVEEVEEEVKVSRAKKRKAVSSKALPKKKIFPFLQLPAEIRNEIYSHCLHDPAGIYLFSTTQKFRRTVDRGSELSFRGRPPPLIDDSEDEDVDEVSQQDQPSSEYRPLVPALLAVCKQINSEARDILYGHDFYVKDTLALHSFLVDLGPRAAGYLKNITLGEWGFGRGVHKAYNHACFTALSSATNLEHFTFHGILSWNDAPKSAATIFYRDAFPWLEAVGIAKGKADAAVKMIDVMVPDQGGSGYSWYLYRRRRGIVPRSAYKEYDKMDGFRVELGKLLNARMERIRS